MNLVMVGRSLVEKLLVNVELVITCKPPHKQLAFAPAEKTNIHRSSSPGFLGKTSTGSLCEGHSLPPHPSSSTVLSSGGFVLKVPEMSSNLGRESITVRHGTTNIGGSMVWG